MDVRAIYVALFLASLPVAGCGTVMNLANSRPQEGGRAPFGGVHRDLSAMNSAGSDSSGAACAKSTSVQFPHVILCAADLPFSFVGDVVTWPYTAAFTYINQPVPAPLVTPAPMAITPQTSPSEVLPTPKSLP